MIPSPRHPRAVPRDERGRNSRAPKSIQPAPAPEHGMGTEKHRNTSLCVAASYTDRPMSSRHTAETSHPTGLAPTCSSRRHRDAIRSVSASVDARHTARNGTPSLSLVSPYPPGAWRWRHDHPYHPASRLCACDSPRCRTALRYPCPARLPADRPRGRRRAAVVITWGGWHNGGSAA